MSLTLIREQVIMKISSGLWGWNMYSRFRFTCTVFDFNFWNSVTWSYSSWWQLGCYFPTNGRKYLLYLRSDSFRRSPYIIRKCVIIDTLRKQVEFKVLNQLCTMEEGFPHNFLTIIDLKIILQKFHSASVCEGIKDEIYHELQFLQIESGVFSAGLWRCKEWVF